MTNNDEQANVATRTMNRDVWQHVRTLAETDPTERAATISRTHKECIILPERGSGVEGEEKEKEKEKEAQAFVSLPRMRGRNLWMVSKCLHHVRFLLGDLHLTPKPHCLYVRQATQATTVQDAPGTLKLHNLVVGNACTLRTQRRIGICPHCS